MQTELLHLWNKCLDIIKENLSEEQYNVWFTPILPHSFNEKKELRLHVPSDFCRDYIEKNFRRQLYSAILQVFGSGTKLFYLVSSLPREMDGGAGRLSEKGGDGNDSAKPSNWNSYLNPKYRFENYFESDCNKLVYSVSESITKNPGKTTYNPLFIYGPSGVGKTHLCHAIGNRIQELHPSEKVLYLSAHLFSLQYTNAVRKGQVNDFLFFYQDVDVLILDDIQELIGKDKTQNTFFHIFNHLHQLNKQLILTSDKAPVDLQGMEERLITRLKWGLTAELRRPDLNLRKQILKNRITSDGIVIPDEAFNFIVDNVTENVRDLEGILVSLIANSLVNNKEIDLALTKYIVGQTIRVEKKQVSIQMIQDIVCKYFNLETTAIQTNSRKREVVQARQITMYLAKKYTDNSFSHIGKIVGKRDHATVLYACKTIKDQIETSKEVRNSIEEIEMKLRN